MRGTHHWQWDEQAQNYACGFNLALPEERLPWISIGEQLAFGEA